jgi:hypothetical protein
MRISRPLPIAIGLSLVLLTGVADATSTTCTTTVVCAEYINSSSGVAIHGEANTGIGIRGTSNGSVGFYGATRAGSNVFAGVEGESLNNNGTDAAGAFGLTAKTGTAPAFGVLSYGSVAGVYAQTYGAGNGTNGTATSAAITALDFGGTAGHDTNAGVFAETTHGTGVVGFANEPQSDLYLGENPVGVLGAAGVEAMNGNGVAIGVEGVSRDVPVQAYNPTSQVNVQLANPDYIISSSAHFSVDNAGNVTATSLVTTKGSYVRTVGASGTTRKSYPARTTAPVMEDFGEAQIVNGRGYVKLDSALSDVIDGRTAYQVFLTPEGDSDGLYVTQKSPAGFVVRESRGGRSTLAFSYRILAKPVDDDARRLALAPPSPPTQRRDRSEHHPAGGRSTPIESLDPFVRLKARLGPAVFARQIEAARKLESVP